MAASLFKQRLEEELAARRKKNPRYSLRTFAAFLGADHSSLSQILRERRSIPAGEIRRWGKKLGMMPEEIAVHVATLHVPDAATSRRQEYLRHWTAEAAALVSDHAHWQIVRLSRTREFQPDCRWIARKIGLTVDEVNLALSRLLRLRLLQMTSSGEWVCPGTDLTQAQFQKRALVRVRELAMDQGIDLRRAATK